ncbi:hypothetical protein HY522_11830 [bacterium]|nr:hypothetical protein [bacterium]
MCYGDLEPDQARGFFWGIVLLILLPPALILYIGGHVYFSTRRHDRQQLLVDHAETLIERHQQP